VGLQASVCSLKVSNQTQVLKILNTLFSLLTLNRPFAKSISQAASSSIFAAASPEMASSSGIYINNCFPCVPSEVSLNDSSRASLWDLSKKILNEKLAKNYGSDFCLNE